MIEQRIHLVECPRDAMQGWKKPISTEKKINYLNQLLKVGFHTLDFGSFVSPKAIPQMADTAEVVARLDKSGSSTQLLAIIANLRGAEQAASFEQIDVLGFPFSVSETFQQRNTQASMETAIERVADIQDLCVEKGKQLV
ncbi:MAG: hydroxymethylglutaryl-CoA lyase, partial [Chitinophagaceae bacterium]|nr:hydroxymethylglutaryl-CoA lyase [Chitinophagaceae bacterium]